MYICVKRIQLAVSYIDIDKGDIEEAIDLDDFTYQIIEHDYEVSRELVNDIPDNPIKFLEEEEKKRWEDV